MSLCANDLPFTAWTAFCTQVRCICDSRMTVALTLNQMKKDCYGISASRIDHFTSLREPHRTVALFFKKSSPVLNIDSVISAVLWLLAIEYMRPVDSPE
jgi:hypothetical protein